MSGDFESGEMRDWKLVKQSSRGWYEAYRGMHSILAPLR